MFKIIRRLGSLPAAVFLISVLMLTLTASTVTESLHGTPFAQTHFYNTRWFDLLLMLFGVNIFCATLTRWPFQKKHIGFVTTHVGILLFLTGSLLSRVAGVEGQMTLFEGQKKSWILQEGFLLQVWEKDSAPKAFPIKNKLNKPYRVPLQSDEKLFVTQVREDMAPKKMLSEGSAGDPANRAIELTLSSELAGLKERFWLVEMDADEPHSFFKDIGPAHVELRVESPEDAFISSKLLITQRSSGKQFTLDIENEMPSELRLEGSDYTISGLRYYPHAQVVERKLVNKPDDVAFNPAVEFDIKNSQGLSEHHTTFFLFPAFPTLRGGTKANFLDLDVALESTVPRSLKDSKSPALLFTVSPEGQWHYQIRSSKNASGVLPLKIGEKLPTGWMDISFEVHETLLRAKTSIIVDKSAKTTENTAVELTHFNKENHLEEKHWLFLDKPVMLTKASGGIKISLEPMTRPLPFALALKDFRKIDYPGTQNPASYESDVALRDEVESLTIEKTIKMNKPLDHKGWRIFQASYIQDPELGEASVFSIAKNPGIPFIYSGGIIILTGVILLFYLHPFFSGKKKI